MSDNQQLLNSSELPLAGEGHDQFDDSFLRTQETMEPISTPAIDLNLVYAPPGDMFDTANNSNINDHQR
ncbi:unnamed protein product [Ambrosiozyma monospora]|uniref:Unnamed protein product n=1 Tax=Ambrosiozyma monospora TaxID=43982 RepID=A0A9W6Z4J7_AMBMO|nr:unnamed protein product [Ambrosiozyma monospora]